MDSSKTTGAAVVIIIISVLIAVTFIFGWVIWNVATGDTYYSVPVEEKINLDNNGSLTGCWNTIAGETGFEETSAALESFSLKIMPDGTVKSFTMPFYAFKDGTDNIYFASYSNNEKGHGGRLAVTCHPVKPARPVFADFYPYHPANFLSEVEKINLTALHYADEIVYITAANTRGGILYKEGDYLIFLQENGTLIPVEKIYFQNDNYSPFPMKVSRMNCSYVSGGISCYSSEKAVIFSDKRLLSADIFYTNKISRHPKMPYSG